MGFTFGEGTALGQQTHWQPATGVFRPLAAIMCRESFFHIYGHATIAGAVGAFQQIDVPVNHIAQSTMVGWGDGGVWG